MFLDLEPSEEEEAWYKVQAQLMLAQIERLTAETAQDDGEVEARREEREAHRAKWVAMSEETNRLLDQLSKPVENEIEDDREVDQELAELRLENVRLCAEVGRKPGWLFAGKI